MKKQFNENGFAVLDYPETLRLRVGKAMDAWRSFCTMPIDWKKKSLYELDNSGGVGYEHKNGDSGNDKKENFHYTLRTHENHANIARSFDDKRPLKFVIASMQLANTLPAIVKEIATKLEAESESLDGLRDEVCLARDRLFIRYIHYMGVNQVGEVSAKPHADKSGFTLHLFESAPGLQCLGFGRRGIWQDVNFQAGQTIVFPGLQLQYYSQGEINALCHRVVATKEAVAVDERFSMVCFVPFLRTPMYNKEGNGNVQSLPPGFNYDMPHDEFRKLFC